MQPNPLRIGRYPALCAILLAGVSVPALAAEVTHERLLEADNEPQNWLLPFANYEGHRYSRLTEINRDNVGDLGVAFTVPVTTGLAGRANTQLENHPLVDDGIMFFDDGGGVIYKVDVSSGTKGQILWTADAAVSKDEQARTRGMTFWGNAVYHNLRDGRVIAVDRDSGEFLWDQQIARTEHPNGSGLDVSNESFTAAPLGAEGRILVGQSTGDGGQRGWLAALDPETGEEQWRTYTVPGPGQPGNETWADDHNAWKTGGGSLWTTGTYDPEQRVTIWGTANPVPMFDPEFRPGDNLFTNSAIAFNIDDGSMKWYFQYTPNESWDYDEQGVHLIYDAEVNGETRQLVGHYARNGFYYQLDRTNGAFVTAEQYVDKITWTAGIDPKTGLPVEYDPNKELQDYIPETRWLRGEEDSQAACPHLIGGVRWQPPAYNPERQVSYVAGADGCFTITVLETESLGPEGGIDAEAPAGRLGAVIDEVGERSENQHGILAAIDVTTGQMIAKAPHAYDYQSGVLATAGGLLFTAALDGSVTAHNDETLEELWRFETGISIKAPPIAYEVNGKQFIAIMVGAPTPGAAYMQEYPELATMLPGAMLYVFAL